MTNSIPDSDFSVNTVISALKLLYKDLRPSEWVQDDGSFGGHFETRKIESIGPAVYRDKKIPEDKLYQWEIDHSNLSKTYGIIACGDGYFTFVPVSDGEMSKENLFWLEIYNFRYDGFVPVSPEDIFNSCVRIDENHPESDGIGSLTAFVEMNQDDNGENDLSEDEMIFVADFLHAALLSSLNDGIFDKHMG